MSAALLREAADRLEARAACDPSSTFANEWKALAAWLRLAAADDETGFYDADLESVDVASAILGSAT